MIRGGAVGGGYNFGTRRRGVLRMKDRTFLPGQGTRDAASHHRGAVVQFDRKRREFTGGTETQKDRKTETCLGGSV
jgi:hypothetical protein